MVSAIPSFMRTERCHDLPEAKNISCASSRRSCIYDKTSARNRFAYWSYVVDK